MKKNREIKRNKKINNIIIICVIVAIALIIGFAVRNIKFSSNANAAPPIYGIRC